MAKQPRRDGLPRVGERHSTISGSGGGWVPARDTRSDERGDRRCVQTVKDNASKMVHDAIKGEMSGWQLIWYGTFGNNDDTIGSEVWTASHDDFAEDGFINFSKRWSGSNGDWEIFGSFTGVAPCPADAVAGLIGARGSGAQRQAAERALEAMREFRAKDYRSLPGLEAWWRAIQEATPDLVRLAARDPGAREAIARLLAAVPAVLGAPDCPLAAEHFRDVTTVLNAVSKANPRLYRAFAHSGLARLADLQGENWKEAIRKLASARPRGRKR